MTHNSHVNVSGVVPKHVQSVTAIILNDNRDAIMMVEQEVEERHRHLFSTQTFWSPPGGKKNLNEDDITALKRETKEETSLILRPDICRLYTTTRYNTQEQFRLTVSAFLCSAGPGNPRPDDPDKQILAARWMPLKKAVRHIRLIPDVAYRDPLLDYIENGVGFGYWSYGVLKDGYSIRSFPSDEDLKNTTRQDKFNSIKLFR